METYLHVEQEMFTCERERERERERASKRERARERVEQEMFTSEKRGLHVERNQHTNRDSDAFEEETVFIGERVPVLLKRDL